MLTGSAVPVSEASVDDIVPSRAVASAKPNASPIDAVITAALPASPRNRSERTNDRAPAVERSDTDWR